jgi:sulfur-carrier protein
MVTVQLDAMMREFLPNRNLDVDAGSVEEVFVTLETRFPRLRFRLRDESGRVRRFIHVFVNGEDIGEKGGLATPLQGTDTVHILHSIQGG